MDSPHSSAVATTDQTAARAVASFPVPIFVKSMQSMVVAIAGSAADSAVEGYKRDTAAAALVAVTALAEVATKGTAATATAPMYPLLRYSMRNAGLLLSIEKRTFAQLKKRGRIITKQMGGHPMVTHAELTRLAEIDDPTPVNAPKKLTAPKKPVQKAKLLTLPKPKVR